MLANYPRLAEQQTRLPQEQVSFRAWMCKSSIEDYAYVKCKPKPRICSSQLHGRGKLNDLYAYHAEVVEQQTRSP